MPGPTLRDKLAGYLTSGEAAEALGITRRQLLYWVRQGVLPAPTMTRRDGLRLFSRHWVEEARDIVVRLGEGAEARERDKAGKEAHAQTN